MIQDREEDTFPINGKPTARWGRNATGQAMCLIAGLPKEGDQLAGRWWSSARQEDHRVSSKREPLPSYVPRGWANVPNPPYPFANAGHRFDAFRCQRTATQSELGRQLGWSGGVRHPKGYGNHRNLCLD